jgi:hypothetical protein
MKSLNVKNFDVMILEYRRAGSWTFCASVITVLTIGLFQSGLNIALAASASLLTYAFLNIFAPIAIAILYQHHSVGMRGLMMATVFIFTLGLLPALSFLLPAQLAMLGLVSISGVVAWSLFREGFFGKLKRSSTVVPVFSLLFALLILFGEDRWNSIFFSDVFMLGIGDAYNYFYGAISNVFQTSQVANFGFSDTPTISYHFLSMAWIAGVSQLIGLPVLTALPMIHVGFLGPILVFSVFIGMTIYREALGQRIPSFYFVACFFLLLVAAADDVYQNLFVMLGSNLAFTLFCFGVPALVAYRLQKEVNLELLYWGCALLLLASAAMAKISIGLNFLTVIVLLSLGSILRGSFSALAGCLIFMALFTIIGLNFSPDGFRLGGTILAASYLQLLSDSSVIPFFFPILVLVGLTASKRNTDRPLFTIPEPLASSRWSQATRLTSLKELPVSALLIGASLFLSLASAVFLLLGQSVIYFFLATLLLALITIEESVETRVTEAIKAHRAFLIIVSLFPLSLMATDRAASLYLFSKSAHNAINESQFFTFENLREGVFGGVVRRKNEEVKRLVLEASVLDNESANPIITREAALAISRMEFSNPYKCISKFSVPGLLYARPVHSELDSSFVSQKLTQLGIWFSEECPL